MHDHTRAKAAILFNYRLSGPVRLDAEVLAYASHASGLPGVAFRTRGDLVHRQNTPLFVRGEDTLYAPYDSEPLLDIDAASLRSTYSNVGSIVDRYAGRDVGADYRERFGVWTRASSSMSGEAVSLGEDGEAGGATFNFTFVMDVPTQVVTYRPTKTDMFKELWVRYLSLMVVVMFLQKRICAFIYYNQM